MGQDCREAVAGGRSSSGLAQHAKPGRDTLNRNGAGTIPDRVVKGAALNLKEGAAESGGDSANRISTEYHPISNHILACQHQVFISHQYSHE